MQDWDEELNKIMQRKIEQYKEKITGQQRIQDTVIVLNDYNFAESINKHPFLIVDFWAPWCGPCKMVSPIIDQLSKEFAGRTTFGKLNVDDNPNISNTFQIQSIPTMIFFKNGQVVDKIIGAMVKSQLVAKIEFMLNN
ncbi:MAG TPA: thioredoxin [Candidatus Nitrosocosmicus sp.]